MAKKRNQSRKPISERLMNENDQTESQPGGGSSTPVADSVGTSDSSAATAAAATPEAGAATPDVQPEAGEPQPGAGQEDVAKNEAVTQEGAAAPAPAPEAGVAAPAPSLPEVIAAAPAPAPETPPAPAPVVTAPTPAPPVQPPAPPVQQPAAAAKPVVEEKTTLASSGPTPYDDVNRLLVGLPSASTIAIHQILEYMEAMAPKRSMNDKTGASNQVKLYRAIQQIINREDEHFHKLFTAVLRLFVHGSNGAFQEHLFMRFMPHVVLSKDDQTGFLYLLNMFRLLGPAEGRQVALTQIDLQKTLSKGLTDAGRSRVYDFFGKTV